MKIAEMYRYKEGKDTFRIQVPITRPGKDININKISFDLNSYVATMQSDQMKYSLKNKTLPVVVDAPKDFTNINPNIVIGKVVDWNPEFIIVEISVENYNKYIAPFNEATEMKAGVIGLGEFIEGSTEVFAVKKVYAFQLLYGIAAKVLEKVVVEDKKEEAPAEEIKEEKVEG